MYFIDHVNYLQGGDGVGIKHYQASRAGPWLVQVFDPAIQQQQHKARAIHDHNINGTQLAGYQINWDQLYGSLLCNLGFMNFYYFTEKMK